MSSAMMPMTTSNSTRVNAPGRMGSARRETETVRMANSIWSIAARTVISGGSIPSSTLLGGCAVARLDFIDW